MVDQLRPPSRKRRRFNEISREVRPYYQKSSASMELITVDSIVEATKNIAKKLWMVNMERWLILFPVL